MLVILHIKLYADGYTFHVAPVTILKQPVLTNSRSAYSRAALRCLQKTSIGDLEKTQTGEKETSETRGTKTEKWVTVAWLHPVFSSGSVHMCSAECHTSKSNFFVKSIYLKTIILFIRRIVTQ